MRRQPQDKEKIAVIEQSNKMYGGTCINIGCIPSKVLVHDGELNKSFDDAFERKVEVVGALNKKNYNSLTTDDEVVDGKAKFQSQKNTTTAWLWCFYY